MVSVIEPMLSLEAEKRTTPQLSQPTTQRPSGPEWNERLEQDQDYDAQFDLAFSYQGEGEYQKAIRHYTKAIELNPGAPEAYINRAAAYASTSEFDLALRDLEASLALNPKAEAYHNLGDIHFKQDNYEQAVQDYSMALELDHSNTGAYLYRAHALRYLDHFNDAIRDYEAVLAQDPTNAAAYLGMGIVRKLMGENDNAIRFFNKALELDSKNPLIYMNRGGASVAKGDIDSAERDIGKALELDPQFSYSYVSRGLLLMGKGDLDGAIQDLENALQLDPDFTYALSMRGMAYLQKGDLDRAIQDFEDALERGLNSSNTYNNRGVAYEMKGDLSLAMQDYHQALRIRPNKEAFGNRGVALLRRSEWDKARSDLLKASNMGSDLTKLIPGGPEAVTQLEKEHNIELPRDIVEMLSVQEDLSKANAGEAVLEISRMVRESIPEGALDDMPTDGARNYKHYLYGWPKK